MDTPMIGIKTADRTFFPIMDDGSHVRRRLVLTTVQDNQAQVQIDLYRSSQGSIAESEYIGSLIIQEIEEGAKGEPEIILELGIDQDGNLNATARDERTGSYQSLSVALESLDNHDIYELPDFEIGEIEPGSGEDRFDLETGSDLGLDQDQDEDQDEDQKLVRDQEQALDEFGEESFSMDLDTPDLEPTAIDQDLDDEEWFQRSASFRESLEPDVEEYERPAPGEEQPVPYRSHPLLYLGFLILALAMLVILTFFVFRFLEADPIPPLRVEATVSLILCPGFLRSLWKPGTMQARLHRSDRA